MITYGLPYYGEVTFNVSNAKVGDKIMDENGNPVGEVVRADESRVEIQWTFTLRYNVTFRRAK